MIKKTCVALAALTLCSLTAVAQSSVTVYGILDAGVSSTSGLKGGTRKAVISGIMDGSRLGFKGNEDLGDGYRALFLLENRLEVDTGSNSNVPPSGSQLPDRMVTASLIFSPVTFTLPGTIPAPVQTALKAAATSGLNTGLQSAATAIGNNVGASLGVNVGNARFWDRQAYVGLVTPVGAILAGRQYTPAYEINAVYDIMATQSSLAVGQVAAVPGVIDIRQSNAVQYRIQKDGIAASVMAAAPEGSTTQGRFYGAMAQYVSEGFALGVGYNTRNNEAGQKSLTTTSFGASMTMGANKVSFVFNKVKDANPSGIGAAVAGLNGAIAQIKAGVAAGINAQAPGVGTLMASQIDANALVNQYTDIFRQDATVMGLGYRYVTGPHTIYAAYNRLNDKTRFNADTDSYGVAYSYAFSKRTDLNVVLTHFNNKGLGQAAPGQAGFLGGFTSAAGVDSNNMAVGLRHRF